MSHKHNYRGRVLRQERREDRLKLRADHYGQRSARRFGGVVSLARMAELRAILALAELPDTVRQMGRVGRSADAYAVEFNGVMLIAVYDRRGRSIAVFLPPDAPEITHADVDVRGSSGPESVAKANSGPALSR